MSRYFDWSAWQMDWMTIWIAFWMVQFAVIEALGARSDNMVTDHLRPIFHSAPLSWWLALGVWLWLGPHMLWPAAEEALRRTVGQ
jgi:hypothetical protein